MNTKPFALFGIAMLLVLLISGCVDKENDLAKYEVAKNYSITDVDVFLKMTGMSYSEFLGSEGLRRQYESWKNGTMDDATKLMIEQKNAKDAAEKAQSGAMGGALIGALVGGMLVSGK